MPKSTAQLKNEESVRKVMKERGYGFLSEKDVAEIKKSEKKRKHAIIVAVCVIALLIPIAFVITNIMINNHKAQVRADLDACLADVAVAPVVPENPSYKDVRDTAKLKLEEDTKKLECHENNKTEKYDEAVSEFSENIERDSLTLCLSNAELNYATSHEEIVNAENDAQSALVIFKRWDSKYSTQIDCYNKYNGTQDFQSELSALRADKSENQSYIDMVNDQIKNQGSSSYYSGGTRLHCSTNSVGSYSWTNCY